MKCILNLHKSFSKWIFLILFGVIISQSSSIAQEPVKTIYESFQELDTALSRARHEDVPLYSPELFNRVVELNKRAQQDWQERESFEQINKLLNLAKETLKKAKETANFSKKFLSQMVETRTNLFNIEQVRYLTPEKLYEAEHYYRDAIRMAENGNIDAAVKSSETAQAIYFEATLLALELGPIRSLRNELIYYEKFITDKSYKEAKNKFSEIENALSKVRKGELEISKLRAVIKSSGAEIQQLLNLDSDFGINWNIYRPPSIVGFHPETFSIPKAPVTMSISERTANTLSIIWKDNSSFEDVNQLERKEGNGPWHLVEEWGPLSGWNNYTDDGLLPDTRYCYRIRVENSVGVNYTPYDKQICAYTKDGNYLPIWRVQLRIITATHPNAGTTDPVQVSLNGALSINARWLDLPPVRYRIFAPSDLIPREELRPATINTFELSLKTIDELSDINMIRIKKEGTNALGISSIGLIVNGEFVFIRSFDDTESTILWIDEGDGYSSIYNMSHSELRAHERWQDYINSPPEAPREIRWEIMRELLQGIIGDAIHGTSLSWSSRWASRWASPVVLSIPNDHTISVNVILENDGIMGIRSYINFDLYFNIICDTDTDYPTIIINTLNLEFENILDPTPLSGTFEFLADDIENEIKQSFQKIAESIHISTGGLCPRIELVMGAIRFITE